MLTQDEVLALRKRVEYEDQLMNSRTSIVLTLNGLMAVAASFQLPQVAKLLIAIIIIIVNALWIICSLDAQRYIHSLISQIHTSEFMPIDEKIRVITRNNHFRIGSTRFMSLTIPSLLLVGWVLALLLAGWKS